MTGLESDVLNAALDLLSRTKTVTYIRCRVPITHHKHLSFFTMKQNELLELCVKLKAERAR